MEVLLLIIFILIFFGTISQYIMLIMELSSPYNGIVIEIESKKELLMWLIPMYMPIRGVVKSIIDRYNKLD